MLGPELGARVEEQKIADLDVGIDRDRFFRRMIRELSGVLQEVVGEDEARGFVSVVGARIGDLFNQTYQEKLGGRALVCPEVADALVDLKARIGGEFSVESQSDDEITFVNTRCPFAESVEGRPSLCMMTSNVFGRIAAQNLGYARVTVKEALATGHSRCLVHVSLKHDDDADGEPGSREYYRAVSPVSDQG